MSRRLGAGLFLIVTVLEMTSLRLEAQSTWRVLDSQWQDIAFRGDQAMAVASDGSLGAGNLSEISLRKIAFTNLAGIACGHGWFVAGSGSNFIASLEGDSWQLWRSGTTNRILRLAFGNEVFVAIAERGVVLTSRDDGVTWFPTANLSSKWLTRLLFLENAFYALVEDDFGSSIYVSANGYRWQRAYATVQSLSGLAVGNGISVAVNGYGISTVSSNGVNWTAGQAWTNQLFEIVFYQGRFLAFTRSEVIESIDGRSWRANGNLLPSFYYNLAATVHPNGMLVVLTSSRILTSTNATTWKNISTTPGGGWRSVFGAARFLVPSEAPFQSSVSTNGIVWTEHPGVPLNYIADMFGTSTGFVAVGNGLSIPGGEIVASDDGIDWRSCYSNTNLSLYSITKSDSAYVAVGGKGSWNTRGMVLTSPDLVGWTEKQITTNGPIVSIAWGNGRFIAAGFNSRVFSSTDGSAWSESQASIDAGSPREMRFLNGRFFFLTDHGTYVSVDGDRWKEILAGMAMRDITYANGYYVCVAETFGFENVVVISRDLVTWKWAGYVHEGYGQLFGITFGHNRFVVAGRPMLGADADLFLETLSASTERQIRVWGTSGRRIGVEVSDDLKSWNSLTNFAGGAPFLEMSVPSDANAKFLRARIDSP